MRRRMLAAAMVLAASAAAGPAAAADPAEGRGQVTSLPLPRFVSLRADVANARRGPSLEHRVDWEFVRPGMPLEVTAEHGNWRRVRDADGAGGWVHHTLLSGVRTVLVRADGLAPVFADPVEAAPVRAYVEPGVIARLERCEAGWCAVTAGGTEGWISRDLLWGVN